MEQICRFCLKSIEISSKIPIDQKIKDQFKSLTNVELKTSENDSEIYSIYSCIRCIENLKLCIKLKKNFIKVQAKLDRKFSKQRKKRKKFERDVKDENFENGDIDNISIDLNLQQKSCTPESLEKVDSRVICPKCGLLIKPKNLQQHIDIHHLNIQKYSCDICNSRFYTKSRLKSHLLRHRQHSTTSAVQKPKLNEQQRRDLIFEFRRKNPEKPRSEIIAHFTSQGFQKSTIYNILKRYETNQESQRKRGSGKFCGLNDSIKLLQLQEAINDGIDSYRELGRMFSVDHKTVKKYLDDMGIKLQKKKTQISLIKTQT